MTEKTDRTTDKQPTDYRWNLDAIYTGLDDPQYSADLAKLEELSLQAKAWLASAAPARDRIVSGFRLQEAQQLTARQLMAFNSLLQSTDSTDSRYTSEQNRLRMQLAAFEPMNVVLTRLVADYPDLDELAEDEALRPYRYRLERMKLTARHLLDPETETLIARLSLSGGNAWQNLYNNLTSTLEVDWEGGTVNLSTIRGLASNPDRDVRRRAYEAELAAYPRIETSIAFAINSIKTQVKLLGRERGYESPLDETLFKSRLSRETLAAMLDTMERRMPVMRRYLRLKAGLLGVEQLAWYDLFAPVTTDSSTYTMEEARALLADVFSDLPEVAQVMRRAFEEEWIDVYPRQGKRGGAFCSNLPFLGQSRVLTNFTGSFDGINTFAHELGHAYHGSCIEDHAPLNQSYSMPVAETASTFNETHLTLSLLERTDDPARQLALLENYLMGACQTICDIYSRFLFEYEVFERCDREFLDSGELQQIMLRAQREAYGDALDQDLLHPYMWVCKGHYFRPGLSFYNFPYAFGQLFSLGLYGQYQQEGEAFLPRYRSLLHETTVADCEAVAARAGIDLRTPDFWDEAFDTIEGMVNKLNK